MTRSYDDDPFGQQFLATGRLSPYVGVTDQWLRVWRIIIGKAAQTEAGTAPAAGGGSAILSSEVATGADPARHTYAAGLRIHFNVTLETAQTPNTAEITIYNLRDDFAKNLIKEGQYVTLECGYEWGNVGAIFTGTIKFFKVGHETATDSYLKIYAADGERAYSEATVNRTGNIGEQPKEELQELGKTFAPYDVQEGYVNPESLVIPPAIREKTIYGQTAEQMRDFAQANGALWDIFMQRYNFQGPKSYRPGQVIRLNATSGLIGFPEVTPDGINVTALINPAIRLRQRIMLNNKFITQVFAPGGQSGGTFYMGSAEHTYASLSEPFLGRDGMYSPIAINYEGDSRGGPWFMYMTCLAVDQGGQGGIMSVLNSVFAPF